MFNKKCIYCCMNCIVIKMHGTRIKILFVFCEMLTTSEIFPINLETLNMKYDYCHVIIFCVRNYF